MKDETYRKVDEYQGKVIGARQDMLDLVAAALGWPEADEVVALGAEACEALDSLNTAINNYIGAQS